MPALQDIENYCTDLLKVSDFTDYCPNGIQVEASSQIHKIVTGVTACQRLIDAAIERNADLLLVHHGYFWKGEAEALRGVKGKRIAALMRSNLSLMAYHLPLDGHLGLGNNANLGRMLGLDGQLVGGSLLWTGSLQKPIAASDLAGRINKALDRQPLHIACDTPQIQKVGWCTGAAQSYLEQAAAEGCDAFVSGEVSEHTTHTARELGIHYFAAGHHATERSGVQALGKHLAQHFSIECEFVDIPNPV